MNNKGFTLIELITTFALATVIVGLLINIVIVMRNIYSKAGIRSQLYVNQDTLSNTLNKKINKDNLEAYEICNDEDFCYIFRFIDGESIKVTANSTTIKVGDYVYNMGPKTRVVNPSLRVQNISNTTGKYDSFLILKLPIVNDIYPNIDFGVNLVYIYDSTRTSL